MLQERSQVHIPYHRALNQIYYCIPNTTINTTRLNMWERVSLNQELFLKERQIPALSTNHKYPDKSASKEIGSKSYLSG